MYINILIKIIYILIGVHDDYFPLKRVDISLKLKKALSQRNEHEATGYPLLDYMKFILGVVWGRRNTWKRDHLSFLVQLPEDAKSAGS